VTFDSRQQSAFPQTLHTMTSSNDTAQTWRDLADQFTAAQITQLERLERDEPQTLLELARQWAAKNTTDAVGFDDIVTK